MSTKQWAAVLAAAAALTAVAGCASSTPKRKVAAESGHAAFVAAANRICQRAVDAHKGHPFPLKGFDPLHPDPSRLPAVGDYFATYGGQPATASALHQLTPPSADADNWRTLLHIADESAANVQRQIAAARSRDVPQFVQTVREVQTLTGQLHAAGPSFGFTDASACSQVFG